MLVLDCGRRLGWPPLLRAGRARLPYILVDEGLPSSCCLSNTRSSRSVTWQCLGATTVTHREGFISKVWLVTGSASGLGRNIAEAVLASGDRLLATARDPEDAGHAAVHVAVDAFERLDVVVIHASNANRTGRSDELLAFPNHDCMDRPGKRGARGGRCALHFDRRFCCN